MAEAKQVSTWAKDTGRKWRKRKYTEDMMEDERHPLFHPRCEMKYYDDLYTIVTALAGDYLILDSLVSPIVQGTATSTRIGNKIKVCRLELRARAELLDSCVTGVTNHTLDFLSVGVQYRTMLRFVLVWDKQANGNVYAATDLLSFNGASRDTAFEAFPNQDNKERFVILWDKFIDVSPKTLHVNTGTSPFRAYSLGASKLCSFEMDLSLPIMFKGNTGNIGDISSNNLSLWMFQEHDTNNFYQVNLSVRHRVYYTDM